MRLWELINKSKLKELGVTLWVELLITAAFSLCALKRLKSGSQRGNYFKNEILSKTRQISAQSFHEKTFFFGWGTTRKERILRTVEKQEPASSALAARRLKTSGNNFSFHIMLIRINLKTKGKIFYYLVNA